MRAVDAALNRAHVLREEAEDTAALHALYQSLMPREQELLPLLASGLANKRAAAVVRITEYIVQVHRGHIMRKCKRIHLSRRSGRQAKLSLKHRRRPRSTPDASANSLLDSMARRK
jgi:FixJ family two-component response regulator